MRLSHIFASFIFALFISTALMAQTPVRVIFINGIQNTRKEIADSANVIRNVLAAPTRHQQGKYAFNVEYIENPIGWNGIDAPNSLWQDSIELFLMKLAEEQYAGDLLNLKSPVTGPPLPTNLQAATNVAQFAGKLRVMNAGPTRDFSAVPYGTLLGDNDIDSGGVISDTDLQATQECITQLAATLTSATAPIIIIAHSQGNLIANLAYAKAARDMYPRNISSFVKIVNIANTSQISLHNLNLTHADDKALFSPIASLSGLPSWYGWNRAVPSLDTNTGITTYSLSTQNFTLDTPTASGLVSFTWTDLTEHGLVDVYLSNDPVTMSDTRGITFSPGSFCMRDYFEDLVWTAAASLDTTAAMPTVQMLNPCIIAGEGQSVTLSAQAMSQVGSLVEVHWERLDHPEVNFSLPAYANTTMSGNTATSSVTFTTPFVAATTTFKVGFFAKDDRGMVSSGTAEVQVQHGNLAPTITADPSYATISGTGVTLHVSAADADGYLVSAVVEQISNTSWLTIDSPQTLTTNNSNTASWDIPVTIPGNTPGGTYTYRFTVTDNDGAMTTRSIDLVVTPDYFVDDFSTVTSVIPTHWAVNSFGSSAFVSGGVLNLQHLVAQSMSLGTRAFHEGTNFRTYAKLSDGGSVRLTAGMDGIAIVQNDASFSQRYQVQVWTTDPNTYVTQTQYFDFAIAPDVYHLFEYIYGVDGMVTLRVDQVSLVQTMKTAPFFYGARMQFSYGQTLHGTGTIVQWAGVTP